MIRVREGVDLLGILAGQGFTTYELRRQGLFGERTIQKLRAGGLPSWRELDVICSLTMRDVSELIEWKYTGIPEGKKMTVGNADGNESLSSLGK